MATRVKFASTDPKTEEVRQLQDNIVRSLNPLLTSPLAQCVLLKDQVIGTSFAYYDHNLNRTPLSYIICAKNANQDVWQDVTVNNKLPTTALRLKATGTVTVDILVF